jgi:hypothetical protein
MSACPACRAVSSIRWSDVQRLDADRGPASVRRRDLGHARAVADILSGLGHPYAALREHDQARAVWQEALDLYEARQCTEDVERLRRLLAALET